MTILKKHPKELLEVLLREISEEFPEEITESFNSNLQKKCVGEILEVHP